MKYNFLIYKFLIKLYLIKNENNSKKKLLFFIFHSEQNLIFKIIFAKILIIVFK